MIKRLIPRPIKKLLQTLLKRWQLTVLWFFSRTRWLSSLYYCFFSRRFGREHQSVLKGRQTYLTDKGMRQRTNTLLRRNIHRIEKGLIMVPQKAVFALGYIGETVTAYQAASSNGQHDKDELKWATDVLTAYFATVILERLPKGVYNRFMVAKSLDSMHDNGAAKASIPYDFASKQQANVTSDDFLALCVQRRSVRWFESTPVPRDLLAQAVTIASLAPSACNRQPYQFYIADNKVLSEQLIATPMGTKGFSHNVPCTIVVTADLANYPTERDRHLIYIDSTLASMQLMLALETLGLSSCPINWPDIEAREQEMAALLDLPDTVRPVMLIAVGYGLAEGKIPFSHKKSAEQLIRWVD